ncbi:MAG: tetratricopeptide repeat protein [Microscillaceae bacterium]|jgi:tetratricopeptide (TPR) repeat protein|nr:tetratricopeptide repeat protein [Microscillaceae bacterium]
MFKTYCIIIIFLIGFGTTNGLAQTAVLDSLENILQKTSSDTAKIRLHIKIAEILSATQTAKAQKNAQKALEIAQKYRLTTREVESMLLIGSLFFQQNKPEKTLQQAVQALKIAEKARDSVLIHDCLVSMSNYYMGQHNVKKSLANLENSLIFFQKKQLNQRIINTAITLGNVYYQSNEFKKAQTNYELALRYVRPVKNHRSLAMCLGNLGNVCDELKDYAQAVRYYQEALAIYRQKNRKFAIAWMLGNLGATYYKMQDYNNAEKYLNEGRTLARETQALEWLLHNYEYSAKLAEVRQDYRLALDFQKQYLSTKDSLFNERKTQQINELQTRFETEKKEAENLALKKERTLHQQIINTQKTYNLLIISLLALVSVIAFFLYWARTKLHQQNTILKTQKEEILQQKEEIQEINEDLDQKVRERTAHLSARNQQLTQYNFINSHKLRAPLANILGLINLAREVPDAIKAEDWLRMIEHSSQELDKIVYEINALLDNDED